MVLLSILALSYWRPFRKDDEYLWEVIYPTVRANGDRCDIDIEHADSSAHLSGVWFGDVWVCAGQGGNSIDFFG